MKITDIKQQVKRQGRYSIFVEGKYRFSLSEAELMKSGIRIGRDYTEVELEELLETAVLDKAYMRTMDLLARRARSEWELRDYLKRKDYDSPTLDRILNRLSDSGYVDDYAFAKSWVENRHLLKPVSSRRLWQELKQKHIADEIISQVLEEDETNELETLKELIAKKRTQSRYQDDQKLMAYLMRQGFRYDEVKQAMAEAESPPTA